MPPLSQPETSRSVNLTGMTYPIPNLCISQSLITELDMTPENSTTAPRRTVLITLRPCALHCNKEEDFLQMAHGKTVSNTAFPAALLFSNVTLCYTGSGWGGINSLHSSPRGAMFWIYDQASAWQHNNVLAIPKQSLHSTKGFSLSLTPSPPRKHAVGGQQVGREQKWDSWPKLTSGIFQSTQCVMLSSKPGGHFSSGCHGLAWHWLAGSDWFCITFPHPLLLFNLPTPQLMSFLTFS